MIFRRESLPLLLFAALLGGTVSIPSQNPSVGDAAVPLALLGPEELDQMLGPIALYPDALIAQMLPAATYPLDLVKAARLVQSGATAAQLDQQDWDPSVKAIAHYPTVVAKLNADLDWTQQLGQAFLAQPQEVMQSIQRLRARARDVGNLVDTAESQVLVSGAEVRIVPTNPEVIYVPVYEPGWAYYRHPVGGGPFLTFGFGMAAGAWLDLDCDWGGSFFYRPGWTWDHWRDNFVLDHSRIVSVRGGRAGHRGEWTAAAWQRDARRPSVMPGRSFARPGQFDRFRGRDGLPPGHPSPAMPRGDLDRGRAVAPTERQPVHAFDPRQPEREVQRNAQRGTASQRGPREGSTSPPARTAPPAPAPRARVAPAPVRIAPPPRAASAPGRPGFTGGGPAGERGRGGRGRE